MLFKKPLVYAKTMTMDTIRYEELRWKSRPLYSDEPPAADDDSQLSGESIESARSPGGTRKPKLRSSIQQQKSYPPIHAETTALLVVDVQPEYWSNCPPVRKDFPEFPEALKKTLAVCRERRTKIIWVRADYRYSHSPWLAQFERLHKGSIAPEVPCDPTSTSFQWESFATPQGGEAIIAKTSWSSTSNTALMDVLRCAGIETVLVCGLITSVCVQHSAFGIFEAGYRTLLVTDACADRGRARHEAALALYGDYMYELVTSDYLKDPQRGLVPAQPVWLTVDSTRNMVRAMSFPKQLDKEGDFQQPLVVTIPTKEGVTEEDNDNDRRYSPVTVTNTEIVIGEQ